MNLTGRDIVLTLLPGVTAVLGVVVGAWLAYLFGRSQAEHQTRFQRTYERRDEVMSRTFELLFEASQRFRAWSSPFGSQGEPPRTEQAKTVHEAMNEFRFYYRSRTLWFDRRSLAALERIEEVLRSRFHDLYDAFEELEQPDPQPTKTDQRHIWREVSKWAMRELPTAIGEVETEFRRSLGLDERSCWRRHHARDSGSATPAPDRRA